MTGEEYVLDRLSLLNSMTRQLFTPLGKCSTSVDHLLPINPAPIASGKFKDYTTFFVLLFSCIQQHNDEYPIQSGETKWQQVILQNTCAREGFVLESSYSRVQTLMKHLHTVMQKLYWRNYNTKSITLNYWFSCFLF
jgi:hypothetical protein